MNAIYLTIDANTHTRKLYYTYFDNFPLTAKIIVIFAFLHAQRIRIGVIQITMVCSIVIIHFQPIYFMLIFRFVFPFTKLIIFKTYILFSI